MANTELKILPKNWKWIQISELALNQRGAFVNGPFGSNLLTTELVSKGIPVIYIRDIRDGIYERVSDAFITPQKAKELEICQVNPGDILIAKVGAPPGTAAIYPRNQPSGIVSQDVIRIRTDKTLVIAEYLVYFLNSVQGRNILKPILVEGTRERFGLTPFKELLIPLPPISEQKRIAAILEKCDRLRRTRRYALQLSDTFLQSVFLEMFGDPATNPMGWEITQLGNLLEFPPQNGLYVPKENYENVEFTNSIEMVHMSDLFYGIVKRGSLKRVNISQANIEKYSLNENDLLVARRSLVYEGAAKPCRIPESQEPLVFESSIIRIRVNKFQLLPVYLYYYLSNERARLAHVLRYVTESTISGINQSGLNSIEIINPPLPLQEKFAQIVQKFERLRTQQREAERQAEHLFQTLLYRAFRGELTSSDFNDEAVSVLSEEIRAQQAKLKSTGDTAEYLRTKAKPQDTEAIQLTLPGLE